MAKFGRFDPRNKKRNKHKTQSQNKDFRIREVDAKYEKNESQLLKEVIYDDEWEESKQILS